MNCLLCGNLISMHSENSKNNLTYVCHNCNLTQTVHSEIVKEQYKKDFWLQADHGKITGTDFNDRKGQDLVLLWNSWYSYCKKHLSNKKNILDIGSGTGISLIMFEKKGFHVTGVEPDPKNTDLINKELKVGHCVNGFIEDLSLDKKFDVIWLTHVIEHVEKPDLLLKKCHDFLKDNGIIFIAVPDCENPSMMKSSTNNPFHLYHFSKKALTELASLSGYKILKCDSLATMTRTIRRTHKVLRKTVLNSLSQKIAPYYPFELTDGKNGYELRAVLTKI